LSPKIKINNRLIGKDFKPLAIAEVGINHEGSFQKAKKIVYDAFQSGIECVKFQYHIPEEEMIKNDVIPGNSNESIWDIISRCTLSEEEEHDLKKYVDELGMIYLSTPFSKSAADKLEEMNVPAFKIGSGECNNYPLVKHIASFGKPIILSTGMNNIESISKSVDIFENYDIPYAILHTTSMYPTPYDKVRLGALNSLQEEFPNAVLGLSDHSLGIYTCVASVALGASILEKHFTSNKSWPGPDIPISITPSEFKELINASNIVFQALGGSKTILDEEKPTIDFAYASVVTIKDINAGELLTPNNIWVKRPGNGEILAVDFVNVLNKKVLVDIKKNKQLKWKMID
jgi:N-acetylneuraminate synthase